MPMNKRVGLWPVLLLALIATAGEAQFRNPSRDSSEQPEKVMEATGVKPGMVIGEIGAGRGYFTFWLSRGVFRRFRPPSPSEGGQCRSEATLGMIYVPEWPD